MDDVNRSKQEEVHGIIRDTVKKFFSPSVHILGMEEQPIKRGYNSVEIYRHKVVITDQGSTKEVCLITKKAALTERLVLSRLASQSVGHLEETGGFEINLQFIKPQRHYFEALSEAVPGLICFIDSVTIHTWRKL